jgi:hypothetical protein
MSTKCSLWVVLLAFFASACGGSGSSMPSAPSTLPQPVAPQIVAQTFTLSGVISRVTSTGTVAAVEGVDVRTGPQHVTTDATGYYSLAGLTATSGIVVNKYGYRQERRTLALTADTRLDLQLIRLPRYTFSGVVSEMTPTGLVPVEGALVTGSFDLPVTTDSKGFFSVPGVYESDNYIYSVYVSKDGYHDYTGQLNLKGDTQLDVQLIRR